MLHIELKEQIEATFDATRLESVTLCRDALDLRLSNGVELTLRIASRSEYAMSWRWGEAEMCIDTAPLHGTLGTYPNHLHTPDGRVVDDPITETDADPQRNVLALIERLLEQPLLGYEAPFAHPSANSPTDAA